MLLAAALLLGITGRAPAQSLFTLRFGDDSDPESSIPARRSVSLAFTHLAGPFGVDVAGGLPTEWGAGTRWAAATGWYQRPEWETDRFGFLATAGAFGYRDAVLDASGLGATSFLRARVAPLAALPALRIRATGRLGTLTVAGESLRRAIGGPGAAAVMAAGPLELEAGADWWLAPEDAYTELSTSAVLDVEPVRLSVDVSHWLHEDLRPTGWLTSVRIAVTDRLAIVAQGGRRAPDLLFWTPSRRSWSIGLRLLTGGGGDGAAVEVPAVIEGRDVAFELSAAAYAERPSVAGTFSDWDPVPMERSGDRWRLRLRLEPGVHEFAFIAADGRWFVPEDAPGRKPDGYGGHVATMIVR